MYRDFSHILLLSSGTGEVTTNGDRIEITGPAAFFMPPRLDSEFTLSAGSESYLIGFSPDLLADAVGDKAESVLLRRFTERPAVLLNSELSVDEDMRPHCRGLIKELRREEGGSWMALSAHARLLLFEVWRSSDVELGQAKGQGEAMSILQSFRQMVEVRFRKQTSIGDYAKELGLSYDRLHAICKRNLGRTPLQLLHERTIHEAKLRLERSSDTIQEIAHQLGFTDAPYFSHFFKRHTGHAPGQYRTLVRDRDTTSEEPHSQAFADWP